jgi:hypothetical protein
MPAPQTNNMEKAFLFDINAKFNVAADDSITETKNFHLSTDYIGKMLAFQSLFEYVPSLPPLLNTGGHCVRCCPFCPHFLAKNTYHDIGNPLCTLPENYQKREKKQGGLRMMTTMTMTMRKTNVISNGHRKRSNYPMGNASSIGRYQSTLLSGPLIDRITHPLLFPRCLLSFLMCPAIDVWHCLEHARQRNTKRCKE